MLWQKRAIPLKAEYFNAEDAKDAEETFNLGKRTVSSKAVSIHRDEGDERDKSRLL